MSRITLFSRPLCANTEHAIEGDRSLCVKSASSACKKCLLVLYCCKDCQVAHWPLHKLDCNSPLTKPGWKPNWETENRNPDFITNDGPREGVTQYGAKKYLWGNVPALDILNSKHNEGDNLAETVGFLFAASGDIRHVVSTLAELTASFSGKCDVVINDRDIDIVARNVLLLLIALHFESDIAVSFMIHLWYSALVPEYMFRSLQESILPLLEDVCSKIQAKPQESLQSKIWKYGCRSLRLVLQKKQWDLLPSYLQLPSGLSTTQTQQVRTLTMLAPSRRDYVDRALYTSPPTHRVGIMKFRKEGVLLPFGSPTDEFDTPNPTFWREKDFWPMMDSADPLEGWSKKDWNPKLPNPKNDVYGALFFHVQGLLLRFHQRIEKLQINFQLLQVDAQELPTVLKDCGFGLHSFDRIEVANIVDRGYMGPYKTLITFSPLLKRKTQNPNATLLTLFLNATHETKLSNPELCSMQSEMKQLTQYLKPTTALLQKTKYTTAEQVKHIEALAIFTDYDALFKRFMEDCCFKEIALMSGLEMKDKHTIVEKWPMRLRKGATQAEFDLLLASQCTGSERYVEWRSLI